MQAMFLIYIYKTVYVYYMAKELYPQSSELSN